MGVSQASPGWAQEVSERIDELVRRIEEEAPELTRLLGELREEVLAVRADVVHVDRVKRRLARGRRRLKAALALGGTGLSL